MLFNNNVIAALGVFTTIASAAPQVVQTNDFSVKQVPARARIVNPAAQVAAVHRKYGKKVPVAVKSAVRKNQGLTGTVDAQSEYNDLEYLAPVTIAGQTFNMNFDTGSSDLWAFSTLQPANQQSGHDLYNPSRSGRMIKGATWEISYGDGSGAGGLVYADSVTIGRMTATGQAVEAATSVSSDFLTDTASDGIVGLAFSGINSVEPNAQKTFFDTISPQLSKKLFTATIRLHAAGSYDFGYINSTRYTGGITYTPVQQFNGGYGYWMFNTFGGFQVQGKAPVKQNQGISVVDTGTTLLYLPDSINKAYYGSVPGAKSDDNQGGWVFPCSATLPNLTLKIAGSSFTIPGNIINYATIPGDSTKCFGGLQSSAGLGMNILGDVFLKAMFIVFDQTQSTPRIGFAQQR